MAEILPFRALQFSPDRVPLDRVLTQPYDKISPEMERRYLDAHPNNLVRIIRPASEPPAGAGESPYQAAARRLGQWRREGIICQASEPCLYAYFQRFQTPGTGEERVRKGFICLTRLEDYASRVVFPHERTLTGPKQDRLELLRSTRTHFGQVFLLYSDPERKVDAVLDRAAEGPEERTVRDEYGVEHRLWSIRDAGAIGAIRLEIADKKLVIADGHHRYETALAFRDERRQSAGQGKSASHDWLMTTLVNMESSGMTILPTHRVLADFGGFDADALVAKAGEYFETREVDSGAVLESMMAERGARRPSFGLATGSPVRLRLLELRDGVNLEAMGAASAAQARLDVVILHRLLLDRCLGLSEEDIRRENYLRYVRGLGEAVDAVGAGRAQAAFLLNATRLDQVRDIAFAGEVLPQKSTDFFPKLLSGLTMYSMD